MSSPCSTPIAWETLVAYWAADLAEDEQDAVEAHLFACESCSAEAARVAAVTESIRHAIPPVLSLELLARLRARGLRTREQPIVQGQVNVARVGGDVDFVVLRLGGLSLRDAQRVSFEMREEGTGRVMMTIDDSPFDRAGDALLLACQAHNAALAANVIVDVRTHRDSGDEAIASFTVHHIYG